MVDYDKRKEEVSILQLFTPTSTTHLVHVTFNLDLFSLSQETERQRKEAEQQQEDEEGWVKVTKGHKGTKARPHSEAANQRTLQKEMRKKKRKELMNFYTWQHRNTQKERKLLCLSGITEPVETVRITWHLVYFPHLQTRICLELMKETVIILFFFQILLN